jgi:hypothetical protein
MNYYRARNSSGSAAINTDFIDICMLEECGEERRGEA